MKTRFLCGALLLSLITTVGYAQTNTNIEELKVQERAKREQLYVLGEKIKKLEEDTVALRAKVVAYAPVIIDAKKRQLNITRDLNEQEKWEALAVEGERFQASFFDIKNKTKGCIINDDFFHDVTNGSAYKFYLVKYFYDTYTLEELLSEWEKLSDEMVALRSKLELAKLND